MQWNHDANYAPATIDVSFPNTPAIGDLIVVAFWNNGQTSGAANTYTAPAGWTQIDLNTSQPFLGYQAFSHVVAPGDMNAYTFTPLAAQNETVWIAAEASHTVGVDQASNAFINSSTAFTTPTLSPSLPGDTAIAFNLPTDNGFTWTNPAPWTMGTGPTLIWSGEGVYAPLSTTAPVSESATLSSASTGFSALVLLSP